MTLKVALQKAKNFSHNVGLAVNCTTQPYKGFGCNFCSLLDCKVFFLHRKCQNNNFEICR